jgi:hypothetical protein
MDLVEWVVMVVEVVVRVPLLLMVQSLLAVAVVVLLVFPQVLVVLA